MDSDHLLAMKLQQEFDREILKRRDEKMTSKLSSPSNSIVSSQWEMCDPNPDIFNLFQVFNAKFFWNQLGCVEVKWSSRMYSCAGTTTYRGMRGCVVTLSLPLLKLRPRKDLVETLLHEMIHAYLFVADRNRERAEHGPKFHSHMQRINQAAGTHITVYHSFHDEVKHYKNHWWRCNGPCKSKPPYFGLVKRTMNRAPGPNDFWFEEHRRNCGGEFIKVKEPEGFKSRKPKNVQTEKQNSGKSQNLGKFLSPPQPCKSKSTTNWNSMNMHEVGNYNSFVEEVDKANNVYGFKGISSTPVGKQQNLSKFLTPSQPCNSKNSSFFGTINKSKGIESNKATSEKCDKVNNVHGFKGTTSSPGNQQNLDRFLSPQSSNSKQTSKFGTVNKLKGIENNKATVEKCGKVNNVHGFKGLTQPSDKTNSSGRNFGSNGGNALLSNRSGTLVERPKPKYGNYVKSPQTSQCSTSAINDSKKTSQQSSVSPKKPMHRNAILPFTGNGQVLNPNCNPSEINRANSRLLKLFPAKPKPSKKESENSTTLDNIPLKKLKLEVAGAVSLIDQPQHEFVSCPVCNKQLEEKDVNEHLDECINLETIMENINETFIIEDDDEDIVESDNQNVHCPVCDYKCSHENINQHLDECLQKA